MCFWAGYRLKIFIKEAIEDPKVVNSKVFLQKAFLFLSGQDDVLTEQKQCLYPYHAIEFDAKGHAYPCITGSNEGEGDNYKNLKKYILSNEYRQKQHSLKSCDKCRGSMMLCYYEPRLNFPLHHLISGFFNSWSRSAKNKIWQLLIGIELKAYKGVGFLNKLIKKKYF